VTAEKAEFSYPAKVSMRSYNPVHVGHAGQIKRAVKLMLGASRPILYTGGGVILGNASASLTKLARELNFPVTNTLMGLGAYPATDPQFVGMLGMHGTYEANMAMHHCDVLIAVGARFDDRVTGNIEKFCPNARIVHIDIDPASISKNVKVDVPIVGCVDNVLRVMLNEVGGAGRRPDAAILAEWWRQIDEWRARDCLRYDSDSELIKPQYVIQKLYEVTQGDAYITSDVGQHQMWAAQYYKFDKPRRWINSGGLGTMGFGLPAAMGVQLAHPDATVACVTGEGSIQMCIQELSTCLQYRLPIKVVNLNNRYLGMVRQWQEFFYQKRYAMSYMESLPDFVKLAESYGHVGMQIDKPSDVEAALREAMQLKDRLVFMNFMTDQTENVYPMIPAGGGQNEMILI
jgi:acetolactate synthase-1/2/3 large subunit